MIINLLSIKTARTSSLNVSLPKTKVRNESYVGRRCSFDRSLSRFNPGQNVWDTLPSYAQFLKYSLPPPSPMHCWMTVRHALPILTIYRGRGKSQVWPGNVFIFENVHMMIEACQFVRVPHVILARIVHAFGQEERYTCSFPESPLCCRRPGDTTQVHKPL